MRRGKRRWLRGPAAPAAAILSGPSKHCAFSAAHPAREVRLPEALCFAVEPCQTFEDETAVSQLVRIGRADPLVDEIRRCRLARRRVCTHFRRIRSAAPRSGRAARDHGARPGRMRIEEVGIVAIFPRPGDARAEPPRRRAPGRRRKEKYRDAERAVTAPANRALSADPREWCVTLS